MRNLEANMPVKNNTSYLFDADLRYHESPFDQAGVRLQEVTEVGHVINMQDEEYRIDDLANMLPND